jgi:hypothetical protein
MKRNAIVCPKGRVIGKMQIDAPLQPAIYDDRPTPTTGRTVFLLA